ncbi:MAG: hypothetical protein M3270_10250 [Thermoproteota archaeon]|nr:hypothetical protein [Thermoproteota archaeon]
MFFRHSVEQDTVRQSIGSSIYQFLAKFRRIHVLSVMALSFVLIVSFNTNAYSANDSIKILSLSSFFDSNGKLNVVGTVRNTGSLPVQVMVSLPVRDQNGVRIDQQPTYGRIIWPLNDSPFKFVLDSGNPETPFIGEVKEIQERIQVTDMVVLNYTSMAVGEERAFIGTVRNNAPFDIYNVSVFASVRSENATQLDSVKSSVIPVLKANEEQVFMAIPDSAIKSKVYYYSCAGLDFNAPISTIPAGQGKFIAYDLKAVAQVSGIQYENQTDSIAFGIRPYGPAGGPVSMMIAQVSEDPNLTVTLDGKSVESSVRTDGKTIYVDFFVPPGQHRVRVDNVTNLQ